jgi:hypothetical protein
MPDIPLKPDDWKKFSQGLETQTADHSSAMAPWGGGLLQKGVEYGGAFARGALKQSAEAPGLSHILPQGITDWAKEVDPAHPDVENAGRYVTPTNAALAFLPDAPFLAAAKSAPWIARGASRVAQNMWKGAAGGASQANVDTPSGDEAGRRVARGAAEGVGTGLAVTGGQAALRAVPPWMLPAAIGAAQLAHGGHYMWHDIRRAMAEGLAMLAARAAKLPPGLVGAGGEAAAKKAGYEPDGGGGSSEPQDEIIDK